MQAIWYNPPNCESLIGWCESNCCKECIAACKQEVDILKFGTGLAFGSAIIKLKNGQLKKVSVNSLTITESQNLHAL